MKDFLILLGEKQPSLFTDNLLQTHIRFLKNLKAAGHLILCGPFSDNQGAMLVIKAISEAQVIELFRNDPFIKKGYYQSMRIHEFTEAHEGNHWLAHSD